MRPDNRKKICHQCRVKTMRTWNGYLCPKCGLVVNNQDTIREIIKGYRKR